MKSIRAAVFSLLAIVCMGWPAAHATTTFPQKLFLQFDGIALSSFPNRHKLTRVVNVQLTQGTTPVMWTASSNQTWLTVTASGQTGGTLTVTADPSKVSGTGLQMGQVTVSTSGGDFSDTETIRVGFWIGDKKPGLVTLQKNATNITANPVEPVAYISDGSSTISEYNVYDGTFIGKFKNVAPTVGALEVSSDGLTLFATDMTNFKIVALNADTGAKLASYKIGHALNQEFNMVYARPYGQPAIYISSGSIVAFPSGEKLVTTTFPDNAFLAATANGEHVFSLSPSLRSYSVKLANGALSVKTLKIGSITGENCWALAVSQNGNHVYPACGSPYEFDVYSGTTLKQVQTLPADHYPNNVEVDANDDVVGGVNGLYDADDIFVFNQKGFAEGKVATTTQSYDAGQQSAAMKVSGDCTRVISVTAAVYNSSQTLMFRDLP